MSSPLPKQINSREELFQLQRAMAEVLFRPLTFEWGMQAEGVDGRPMKDYAAEFIKPNDRLTSFERLEIYNRQYWFRVLDCLYDDYPGLLAVLGNERFLKLATAYLIKHQSVSYTLRDLGDRLEPFIQDHPELTAPDQVLARDMARFEWAQVVAFDGPAKPILVADDIIDGGPYGLTLGLQPYLSVLQFDYPVDEFLLATKKQDTESLRGEASNAVDAAPEATQQTAIALPEPKTTYLAIHRFENALFFKRLEPEGFAILRALGDGLPLEDACAIAVEKSPHPEVDWPTRIREWFDDWSVLGWFCRR
jgi:hypothetical protein